MIKIIFVSKEKLEKSRIKDFLTFKGYQVITTEEPAKALNLLSQNEEINIIITELELKGINGMELLRRAKNIRDKIQVIILSRVVSEVTKEHALKKGAIGVLEEPVDFTQLSEYLKEAAQKAGQYLSRGKILVTDDNEELRTIIENLLDEEGYEVDTAEDGEVAIEKVKNEDYDIILMDIHMPKVDGIEAVRRIKKVKPASYIVMMTGEADEKEVKKALEEHPGHYAVLRKPFDYATLLVSIKHLKEEAEEYKRLATRSLVEKTVDYIKEEEIKVKMFYLRTRERVFLWAAIVILAIVVGFTTTYVVNTLPKFFGMLYQISDKIEQIHQDIDRMRR